MAETTDYRKHRLCLQRFNGFPFNSTVVSTVGSGAISPRRNSSQMEMDIRRSLRYGCSPDARRTFQQPADGETACEDQGGDAGEYVGTLIVVPLELLKGDGENPELQSKQENADHKRRADEACFAGRGNGTLRLFTEPRRVGSKRGGHGSTPMA